MRKRRTKAALVLTMVLSGAFLFASGNLTCGSFATEAGLSTVDLCFVFDCVNGAFGGLLQFCSDIAGVDTNPDTTGDQGFPGPTTGPLFSDCPTDDTGT